MHAHTHTHTHTHTTHTHTPNTHTHTHDTHTDKHTKSRHLLSIVTNLVTTLIGIVAYCYQSAGNTIVSYIIQPPTQRCAREFELKTIQECIAAQKLLAPRTAKIKAEYNSNAPPFCSRHQSEWFFNLDEAGRLDGESEPVCETTGEMCGHCVDNSKPELFCP